MSTVQQRYLELFDYADGKLYWRENRGSQKCKGKIAGTLNSNGYVRVRVRELGGAVSVHRVIYCMQHGYMPDFIDHINGNRDDNRIENLRAVTQQQNSYNGKIRTHNTSGSKNVSWNKRLQQWGVSITVNYKRKFLGLFEDLELADLVAMEARNKYHGLYANHGVPKCQF
jgi:ribosomal protein L35AE/L33A